MDHPYVASVLALFVYSAITWWAAYRCGYDRGMRVGKKKGFRDGFYEAEGRHDA